MTGVDIILYQTKMIQQILPGFPSTSVLSQKQQHVPAAVSEPEAYSAQQKGHFLILLVLPEKQNKISIISTIHVCLIK